MSNHIPGAFVINTGIRKLEKRTGGFLCDKFLKPETNVLI